MHTRLNRTACFVFISIMLLITSGCYDLKADRRNANNYGSRIEVPAEEQGNRTYGIKQQSASFHDNKTLAFSQSLSREVEELDGVNSAIVMLTDRNAYCAILVDSSATGTTGSTSARKETNNSGTSLGRYNPFTFNQYANPEDLATGINNYDTVEDPDRLAHGFKQSIAERIKAAYPSVQQVYISANRDFINQMNTYAQESWKGYPLDGYVEDFNRTVRQLFSRSDNKPVR
ncbi:Lipoprotein yhcN precursor [Chlamydia abortus]|uniref:YhcN/YlaJ family sporulation lipoprotein n=1 Tax=Paenibacillus residui TaxID=629724 RepID=A0ABW3D309_9BACL|nr:MULTISPECIES: YhcN/YlaJ family sporulation lipoprotein [Paenibacillaceae]SHE12490.1 Lipoprotein yhcN precursor [Chlamydia abortus]